MITGDFKRFWGSLSWEIRIDYKDDLSEFDVIFKNVHTDLENTFGLNNLCETARLMMLIAKGFEISIFDRRLANWLEEYFNEHGTTVDNLQILNCLKSSDKSKVKAKIKRLTSTHKSFFESIDFDEKDLQIDFSDKYAEKSFFSIKDERITDELQIKNQLITNSVYKLGSEVKTIVEAEPLVLTKNEQGTLIHPKSFVNNNKEDITNLEINDSLPSNYKLVSVLAKILDEKQSELALFQPVNVEVDVKETLVNWKIEVLPVNHSVKITYTLQKRVKHIIETKSKNTGEEKHYLSYSELNSLEGNRFKLLLPQLSRYLNINETSEELITVKTILPNRLTIVSDKNLSNLIDELIVNNEYCLLTWNDKVISSGKEDELTFIVEELEENLMKEKENKLREIEEAINKKKEKFNSIADEIKGELVKEGLSSDELKLLLKRIDILKTLIAEKEETINGLVANDFPLCYFNEVIKIKTITIDAIDKEKETIHELESEINNKIEEQERLEQERLEQERLEQERLEQERLEQERLEQERLEQERLEQERLEQERLERERLEQEKESNIKYGIPSVQPKESELEGKTIKGLLEKKSPSITVLGGIKRNKPFTVIVGFGDNKGTKKCRIDILDESKNYRNYYFTVTDQSYIKKRIPGITLPEKSRSLTIKVTINLDESPQSIIRSKTYILKSK